MFVYEDGLPVGYDCTLSDYYCRNGCVMPEIHAEVERRMLAWFRSLPGQSRRRLGKVSILQGQAPNLDRLEKE